MTRHPLTLKFWLTIAVVVASLALVSSVLATNVLGAGSHVTPQPPAGGSGGRQLAS